MLEHDGEPLGLEVLWAVPALEDESLVLRGRVLLERLQRGERAQAPRAVELRQGVPEALVVVVKPVLREGK